MADRFVEGLGKEFFFWSGWAFTVGGAVGSFVIAEAYAWIGWLFVAVGLLALTDYAVALHRRIREFEELNRRLTEQAAEADRRLNAVSMAVLEQLAGIVSSGVSGRLVELILERIGFIERLRRFQQPDSKSLNPRTLTKEAGRLYTIAKTASAAQAAALAVGDEFSLVRKSADGVSFPCARLRVNQPPEKDKLVFEVADVVSGEMTVLNQLADGSSVGIKGYFMQPVIDVTTFAEFDAETVATVVRQVAQELDLIVGGPR